MRIEEYERCYNNYPNAFLLLQITHPNQVSVKYLNKAGKFLFDKSIIHVLKYQENDYTKIFENNIDEGAVIATYVNETQTQKVENHYYPLFHRWLECTFFYLEEGFIGLSIIDQTESLFQNMKEDYKLEFEKLPCYYPCGFGVYKITEGLEPIYYSEILASAIGYQDSEYQQLIRKDALSVIYKTDYERLHALLNEELKAGKTIDKEIGRAHV